ncbi:MAG: hypothetical protein IKA76_07550 [Clostridia bacterium]|nr:hypothetical protein [Clostridia bacterium]
MIQIKNTVLRTQNNFWNACVFHPTDAVEDPWGKRILDQMSEDGAIRNVRVYSMFEDIVYLDEDGGLCYDFRLSDLRLDYLMERGYDLLVAYAGIPDCIASSTKNKTTAAKNKTRYKGKMWNTSPPRDYRIWEEICYEYTKHNVERYGIEAVAKWHCQCFNEPDISIFFLSDLPRDAVEARLAEYCKLYEAFERGVRRVSDRIRIGGPALAHRQPFLEGFLDHVKENHLKLDFISLHSYGTSPEMLNDGSRPFCVSSLMEKYHGYFETIRSCGFGEIPILIDEWGMASAGFYNREECPALMARESEVFSAYFVKLIHDLIHSDMSMELLAICLSGQHEMTEDFSGFRNFFTLNFIRKPIYNAHILASKLGEKLLQSEERENLFVIPTKNEKGDYAVLLSYSSENFREDLPDVDEKIVFADDISDKTVTVYCIDKNNTNPYRMWERAGEPQMTEAFLKELRMEGTLKPIRVQKGSEPITISMTPNATYLITVEK